MTSQHLPAPDGSSKHAHAPGLIAAGLLIGWLALVMIVFNRGIWIGYSNHAPLLSVVRHLLDPGYLPNDFGIALRDHHHLPFVYLVAALSAVMGEDQALIALTVVGMLLLSGALFALCRAAKLPLAGTALVGLLVALQAKGIGKGLELNTFVGNPYIMPPTFATALVMFAVASVMRERYRITALWLGLAVLFHLQIGILAALILLPFYLSELRRAGLVELAIWALLFLLPATLPLLNLVAMLDTGTASARNIIDYINFRQPHHFALRSVKSGVMFASYFGILATVWWWLAYTHSARSRAVGILLGASLGIGLLSLLHFADYYLLRDGRIALLQGVRMSPIVSVFAVVSAVALCTDILQRWTSTLSPGTARTAPHIALAVILILGTAMAYERGWGDRSRFVWIKRFANESSTWVDIAHHAGRLTPADALLLTPPGNVGFTYLSERSTVVDFKTNPDGGRGLDEWYRRLRDVAGGDLPDGKGFSNARPLNEAYGRLTAAQLATLARRYGASHAVLPANRALPFEVLYKNADYQLVRLP